MQPIPAEWAGITHAQRVGREAFILYFLTFAGDVLGLLQYETLRIAFDLAWDITGIPPAQWQRCHIDLGDDSELIPWKTPSPR